jgi:CubicO group peptidase (beta-lactamase class C family)
VKLEALLARAKRDVDQGIVPSCQLALARNGKLAAFETFGRATMGGSEQRATNDTLYSIFSSTKAIVGVACWALIEEGLLRIEERVAEIIPEFGTNGKEQITVEQTMLHIAGFPLAPMGPRDWGTRESRLAKMASWRLNWEPGSRFEYHATSAHWVLAEIIERRTGKDFRVYIRERLLDPMQLDNLYIGLPDSEQGRVADCRYMGPPEPPPGGWGEVTPDAILRFNEPEQRKVGVPGGGGIARAGDMALFYDALVNGGMAWNGVRILKPETIAYGTQVRTKEYHVDPLLGHPINRGLTVMVAGGDGKAHMRSFGHNNPAGAFGHAGAGGQLAWCDPGTGISFCYLTDGHLPDLIASGRKGVALNSLAGDCLAR